MLKNNLKYQKIQKCSEGNHMKIAVIYFSRGGNTRKIAEAMAEELGVIAVDVKKEQPDVSDADLLVVGSGTYGSKPGIEMVAYLESLKPVEGKKAACFSSCASGDASRTLQAMKDILSQKGYSNVDCFSCLGKWLMGLSRRGHPSDEEIAEAREFAKKLKSTV
jgi:flavodoxin